MCSTILEFILQPKPNFPNILYPFHQQVIPAISLNICRRSMRSRPRCIHLKNEGTRSRTRRIDDFEIYLRPLAAILARSPPAASSLLTGGGRPFDARSLRVTRFYRQERSQRSRPRPRSGRTPFGGGGGGSRRGRREERAMGRWTGLRRQRPTSRTVG